MTSKITYLYQIRRIAILFIYIIVLVVILEALLRLSGYQSRQLVKSRNPKTHQLDSVLGWKPRPGKHQLILNDDGYGFTFNYSEETGRKTSDENSKSEQRPIQLVGGSFFFGIGVEDNQSCAWQLQTHLPAEAIQNKAVGAYGTYQSLLMMEKAFKDGIAPKVIIYGLINHHMKRNVASFSWMENIYYTQPTINPEIPFATMDKGNLKREKPTNLVVFPFAEKSVFMYMVQSAFNKILSFNREQEAEHVTIELIREMESLCQRHNTDFYVAILESFQIQSNQATDLFKRHKIAYIDCHVPLTSKNTIKGDGHPLPSVHATWAERISRRLIQDSVVTLKDECPECP